MRHKPSEFIPVILAGGSGTRLWPLSRTDYPKQFLTLSGENSLLQQTVLRASSPGSGSPLVICAEKHRFLAAEQLRAIDTQDATILLEPVGRNTAPAIAIAAWKISLTHPDAVMVVLPADHMIPDEYKFRDAIADAVVLANQDKLVTLGITPTSAETRYGYIESNENYGEGTSPARIVGRFVEKPDLQLAEQLLAGGKCYWNAGIFVFKASAYLDALRAFQPEMYSETKKSVENAVADLDFIRLDAASFEACDNISVDYAIMERSENVLVLPFESQWSDIGSWDAVHQTMKQDRNGNSSVGDVLHQHSKNTHAHSSSRLVVTLGTENISVIETSDAVVVIDNGRAQDIKGVVEALKNDNRSELTTHTTVYRPWGHYECLKLNTRFQVKRITVKPGAKLSLQKHFHRSEHWVVVSGTAIVTIGEDETMLSENESTYIPLGTMHRLYNPGRIALELIEVQSGAYLGEDDIVRVGDEYGRAL